MNKTLNYIILPQEIINELKDILLELTDIGFTYQILHKDMGFGQYVGYGASINNKNLKTRLNIYLDDEMFIYTKEISEVIERIKDYLNLYHINIHIFIQNELGDYESKLKIGRECYDILIYFTKK
jgi:sulfite reductase beta subunit-like hemoprotein